MSKHFRLHSLGVMLVLGLFVSGIAAVTGHLPSAVQHHPVQQSITSPSGGTMQGAAETPASPAQPATASGLDCVVPSNWLKCAMSDVDNGIIDQEMSLMQGTSGLNGDATLPTSATAASATQTQAAQGGNEPPLFGYILNTDHLDTYDNPIVKNLHDTISLPMVDALVVLIVLVSGYLVLFGDMFADGYQYAKTVIPQILLALFAAHASLLICRMLIDLANGLTERFAVAGEIAFVEIVLMRDPTDLGKALLILGYVVVLLIFIVQMIGRLALVNLLIILSPFGLVCWALPQTRAWGQWWMQLFVATVFVQFIQVSALALGTILLAAIGGGTALGTSAFNLIWGMATLLLALKIPDLLRTVGLNSGGSGRGMSVVLLATRLGAMVSGGAIAGTVATKALENGLDAEGGTP